MIQELVMHCIPLDDIKVSFICNPINIELLTLLVTEVIRGLV